jgi:hypothetical protein
MGVVMVALVDGPVDVRPVLAVGPARRLGDGEQEEQGGGLAAAHGREREEWRTSQIDYSRGARSNGIAQTAIGLSS